MLTPARLAAGPASASLLARAQRTITAPSPRGPDDAGPDLARRADRTALIWSITELRRGAYEASDYAKALASRPRRLAISAHRSVIERAATRGATQTRRT